MDFSNEDYTSVSVESPDLSQVIQVYDYPASGPEDLNVTNIIEKRNMRFEKLQVTEYNINLRYNYLIPGNFFRK